MSRPRYETATVFNFLHDYGCDVRARRVFFHHSMYTSEDQHSIGVEYVVRNLLHLDKSAGPIELWINNPGGDLTEMWGVVDVVKVSENPVHTVAYGNVSSAACLLLASGAYRYALPHASFMWHAGTTDITDDMHWTDAKDRMAWEDRETERWVEAMARATKPRDPAGKQLRTIKGRIAFWNEYARGGGELWFDAEEMIAHGIIDEVWT